MSEKEFSEDGDVPEHILEEHGDEEAPSREDQVEAAEENRAERNQAERLLETESRDSGHDSPIEGAIGDSGHDSPLEGAVGGALDDNDLTSDVRKCNRPRIKSGKEDLFRKFFDKEYDQPMGAPVLDRHRHPAQVQSVRQRHVSEDSRLSLSEESKLSDPNPLGCLQDAGTSSGAVLNQAGAIIGKNIPKEEIPDFKRFGTEFGQSLPLLPREEGSERSISSIETARIADLYGWPFGSRPPSDDSRGLSPGSSFPSFSSRPPTAASDNSESSPLPNSKSSEDKPLSPAEGPKPASADKPASPRLAADPKGLLDDKLLPRSASDPETSPQEKRARQRRSNPYSVVSIRSKSAHAGGCLFFVGEPTDREPKGKSSKDKSVSSEQSPERKLTKDSSVDSEQTSLEDETVSYPELSHSLERDSCVPMPDLDSAAIASLAENLTVPSETTVEQNILQDIKDSESEKDPVNVLSCEPDPEESKASK